MNYITKSFFHSPYQLAKKPFSFAEIALYPLAHWWVSGRLSYIVGQPLDERECFGSQIQSFISLALRARSVLQHLMVPAHRLLHSWGKRLFDPFAYNAKPLLHFYHSFPLCPDYIQTLSGLSRAQTIHRGLQYPAPDLPREKEQTVLRPWSPSAEHASG